MYIFATPPLRYVRIAIILSSVSMTLLLLRNNCILPYQSSNFVQFPLNYPRSRTILLVTITYTFLFIGTCTTDISLSDHLFVCSEAFFMIFNNPSLSDSASLLFVLYELILSLCSLHHMCFICLLAVTLPNHL